MSKKKDHVTVDHEYDLYPMYQLCHGRSIGFKVSEIEVAANLLDAHRATFPKAKSSLSGLHILELLAGSGEYEKAWNSRATFEPDVPVPDSYYSIEGVEPKNMRDNFYVGNLATVEVPTKHNFIIAPYFSINSILDMDTKARLPTRAAALAAMKNCASILGKSGGGWLYLHFSEDTAGNVGEIDAEHFIPRHNGLRKMFGIGQKEHAMLTYTHREQRDYVKRANIEYMTNIKVTVDGKVRGTIKVKNPISFRYWSSLEIMDILHEAGFDLNAMVLGHSNFDEADPLTMLAPVKAEVDDEDERSDPNVLVVYAPPTK